MSTKLIALALSVVLLRAQGDFMLTGEIHCETPGQVNNLEVQLYDLQNHTVVEHAFTNSDGSFRFYHVTSGSYAVRIKSSSVPDAIVQEYREINQFSSPLIIQLPERAANHPISGFVSLHELQHTPSKRAVRAALEAQRFSQAKDLPRAIERLEEAVRIDPEFRDAHTNLGAQYAHAGRIADALAELRRALEIGPPDAIIYSNLAWAHLALHQPIEAEAFARKAVALDPSNAKAQFLLRQCEVLVQRPMAPGPNLYGVANSK